MTRSKLLFLVLGLGVLASGMSGCGGASEDGPKGGDLDTGLPPEKTLDSLTDAEARQSCQRFYTTFNERYPDDVFNQKLCTRLSVSLTSNRAMCEDFLDSCTDMPAATPDAADCATADASQFDGCEATVAELETCSNDLLGFFDDFLNEFSCSDAGRVDDVALTPDDDQPASCTRLTNECPNAMLGFEFEMSGF